MPMFDYTVWRRSHSESQWHKTSHVVKARTDKEAQAKMRRKFQNWGLTSMSLIAMLDGIDPK